MVKRRRQPNTNATPQRKLTPAEQKQLIARYMADERFVAGLREAQEALARGDQGVPFKDLIDKSTNGGS